MSILFGLPASAPRVAAEAVLNSVWQGALLASSVWVLLLLFRRAGANVKYSVWLATLLTVVCLPFLNALTRSDSAAANDVASPSSRREVSAASANTKRSSLQAPAEAWMRAGADDGKGAAASPTRAEEVGDSGDPGMMREPVPRQEGFTLRLGGERWPRLFLVLWALGASLMTVRLVRGYVLLLRLKRASRPLADNFQRRMSHWSESCGIKRAVSLRGSKRVGVPLMLGLGGAAVLFPEGLADRLSEDEFDQVLLHELAHVRRRDDWGNLAQKLVEAVFFFHPVVWWLGRQLSAERECACDQWVVSVTGARRSYASCLTRLFELTKAGGPALPAPGASAIRSHLSRRVETVLESKRRAPALIPAAGFLLPLCLLTAMTIYFGRLSPLIAVSSSTTAASGESPTTGEALGSSASSSEPERTGPRLGLARADGRASFGAAQPAAFTLPAGDVRDETPSGLAQSSTGSAPATQGPVASPAVLSADESPATSDLLKSAAAGDDSASQRETLSGFIKQPGITKEDFIRALSAAKSIRSDGEKAEFLAGAAGTCTGDAEVLDAFFNAVSTINSGGERRRVLSALLKSKGRDKAVLFRTLKAASAIYSDGEKAELLEKAAALHPIDTASLPAFLDAVSSLNSSAEQRRALTALIRRGRPGDEVVIQTVRFARRISSDGEKAEFLERVAEVGPFNDGLLSAYLATASSIHSSAERVRALSAISKRREAGTATARVMSLAANDGARD